MTARVYASGIVAALAIAAAGLGYFRTPAPAVAPKPIPKIAPMDMKRFFEEGAYRQQGQDLHSLGKAGPAHDAWILRQYGKPKAPSLEPPRPIPAPRRIPARQPGAREA